MFNTTILQFYNSKIIRYKYFKNFDKSTWMLPRTDINNEIIIDIIDIIDFFCIVLNKNM